MGPVGRTRGPITFYWVGVGKRSIASFVALDALFKMSIGVGGTTQRHSGSRAQNPHRAGSKNPSKLGPFAGPKILVQNDLRFLTDLEKKGESKFW